MDPHCENFPSASSSSITCNTYLLPLSGTRGSECNRGMMMQFMTSRVVQGAFHRMTDIKKQGACILQHFLEPTILGCRVRCKSKAVANVQKSSISNFKDKYKNLPFFTYKNTDVSQYCCNFKVMVEFLQLWLQLQKSCTTSTVERRKNFASSTRFYLPLKTHRFASV